MDMNNKKIPHIDFFAGFIYFVPENLWTLSSPTTSSFVKMAFFKFILFCFLKTKEIFLYLLKRKIFLIYIDILWCIWDVRIMYSAHVCVVHIKYFEEREKARGACKLTPLGKLVYLDLFECRYMRFSGNILPRKNSWNWWKMFAFKKIFRNLYI